MIRIRKKLFLTLAMSLVASCSQVLETVTLDLNDRDPLEQEQFTVIEKTLTMAEAKAGNSLPFNRLVSKSGAGKDANLMTENQALKSYYPPNKNLLNIELEWEHIIIYQTI